MNEQETIDRVAIAINHADMKQYATDTSWTNANDFIRNEYRKLAAAAIAEYRRVQEEQAHNGTN